MFRPIGLPGKTSVSCSRQQDYNEYCYIVAGTVGHMVTELVAQHYGFSESVVNELNCLGQIMRARVAEDEYPKRLC